MVPCALLKASRTILQFCVWVSASKYVSSFMNGSIANTVPKSAIVPHSSSTCATTRCSCTCSSKYAFSGATRFTMSRSSLRTCTWGYGG